ncbi:hypothetical protein F5888DRAFT_1632913 [Russula emetica]|nr:hypothetical protein F5888DRAFT_1632913 [Russula emetica]
MATCVQVVVKFVTSYGKEVHEFLVEEGCAPKLRYYGPLPGRDTGLSNDSNGFPQLAQSTSPSLRLNDMHMVVMDYIEAGFLPDDARSQIEKVLTLLHAWGYVFGGKVKFVDFDWCGPYKGDPATFAYYPLVMSRSTSKWAADMKPLGQILLKHDWGMF